MMRTLLFLSFFFFNDTATTEIYTLSLHDALPILLDLESQLVKLFRVIVVTEVVGNCPCRVQRSGQVRMVGAVSALCHLQRVQDRKSTRLNSSHQIISYAVFCLKKKKITEIENTLV